MNARAVRIGIASLATLLACAGCGFKGPLYLPEHNATVVTHPAKNKGKTQQPSSSSAPSQPQTSPATSPPP
jgi:predicted small lipoprotein YifL